MEKPFHTYIRIFLALSLLAMLAACGNEAAKRLELADNIMKENPDSALAIIESIDTASLTRERDLRLRDLLLAQAKLKIFQEASIDTVSLKASNEYFSRHPRKDYLLRSNYYLGYLAFIDSSFNKGMSYAADAFYESKDFDNSIWTARSAELISFIFGRCNNCLYLCYQKFFIPDLSVHFICKLAIKITKNLFRKICFLFNGCLILCHCMFEDCPSSRIKKT